MEKQIPSLPKYGWRVKLNHVFSECRSQFFRPSFRVIYSMLGMIIRYICYQLWCYLRGRMPVMDYIKLVKSKQMQGVPLGGIGGGTIGRGFRGEFCRFQMKPGIYEYEVEDSDQFIVTVQNGKGVTVYQKVLSTKKSLNGGQLSAWNWGFPGENAEYLGLYPRSWTKYDIPECHVALICRQVSPVFPHNYKDTSIPGGVFIWSCINKSDEPLSISVTMTLKGYKGASMCDPFDHEGDDIQTSGIMIYNDIDDVKCTFAFGVKERENVQVGGICFNPRGTGAHLWDLLNEHGGFPGKIKSTIHFFGEIACGISAKVMVQPGSSEDLEFAFIWHMPLVQFRDKSISYLRYYTRFVKLNESGSGELCHYALCNYKNWEISIENWQKPVLEDETLPDWYKSAIFNELYYVADGGTVWLLLTDEEENRLSENDPRKTFGRFAYLEGHEYRMYNTYDVHFYASFALADMWPKLQAVLQYDFRDQVYTSDDDRRFFLYEGAFGVRKKPNCIPHDLGDPEEVPFVKINAYPMHDVTDWRDLNLKFVLQCYRDSVFFGPDAGEDYLRDMWPQIKSLMEQSLLWDTDNDGMIENGNFPDQTYDTWSMYGVSSYCGSLWLAALYGTMKMAKVLSDDETAAKYEAILKKGSRAFEDILWTGEYYKFDSANGDSSRAVMTDQLCGLWYLMACEDEGGDKVLPEEHVKRALSTIYEMNVCKFAGGESGAVNGTVDGKVDLSTLQSQEVWTGVTYALASQLIYQGMKEEGLHTARGLYETIYNKSGLGFETPEALYEGKFFRSIGYMRPLSCWSMQMAWKKTTSNPPLSD